MSFGPLWIGSCVSGMFPVKLVSNCIPHSGKRYGNFIMTANAWCGRTVTNPEYWGGHPTRRINRAFWWMSPKWFWSTHEAAFSGSWSNYWTPCSRIRAAYMYRSHISTDACTEWNIIRTIALFIWWSICSLW